MTKTAEIHLPYFKQGDDLCYHLKNSETIADALESHAQALEEGVAILRKIKEKIANQNEIDIDADTHMICITGPDELIDDLIKEELATESELDDEDDEDWDNDFEEDEDDSEE